MGLVESPLIALLGLATTIGVFAYIYRDARRLEMGRPRLWAAIAATPVAMGFWLYLFVETAPMTGILVTANTGLVLYGFEREVSTEDDEPAEPGQLPHKK